MHQFVQSAIEAAKQGDNNKAMAFIKQVLNANPNDVDAWLVLAAVVDDPQRKRQCLKRVLSIDPVNVVAREELMDMDRAEMGNVPAFTEDPLARTPEQPASVSETVSQPPTNLYSTQELISNTEPQRAKRVTLQGWGEEEPQKETKAPAKAKATSKAQSDKPQVFKYPIFWRIIMYVSVVFFSCVGVLIALQNIVNSLLFFGLAFIMLITALAFSPNVEISEKGIRASGMFSSATIRWEEIVKVKSNNMKRRLELSKKNGEVVNVSTQVSGYPQIVETIRAKRPDLFGMASKPQTQTSAFSSAHDHERMEDHGSAMPAASFKGTRTFKKSFFKQYGSYLIVIPLFLFAAYTVFAEPQYRIGASIAVLFCLGMLVLPFLQISEVKVEPNKLTVASMFEEKTFKAKDIREIKMQTVRGRRGNATNFVNIIPIKGKNYPLEGFSEGDEIIYGILMNWWNSYRSG